MRRLLHRLRFLLAVLASGVAAGLGAIAFYALLAAAQRLFWGGGPDDGLIALAERAPAWKRLLWPAAGGLVVGGLAYVLRGEVRHGVSELLEVVGFGRRPTRTVNAARRVLSAIVTMASGGSAGQEGPIVQLGGSLSAALARAFRLPDLEARTLVACGIGAGVAAAFNTPLGGALFAIEVAIGATSFEVAGPVLLACVAAHAVARTWLGAGPLYSMALWQFKAAPAQALPFCAVLGAIGGAAGGLYALAIEETSERARRLAGRFGVPRPLLPALGGLLVGGIGVFFFRIHGNGYKFIEALTSGAELPLGLLLGLAAAKLVATALTLGSGGGGGIFTPALFIGAALGSAFGLAVRGASPGVGTTVAEFAVIGMAAVFSGVFHAPLTAIVIHLEMTRDLDASLALIVAVIAAQAATRLLAPESIYHRELARRGTSWSFEPRERALRSRSVGDVLRPGGRTAVRPEATFEEVARRFVEGRELRVYVAGERFEGAIDLHDVKGLLGATRGLPIPVIAGELVRRVEPIGPEASLEAALRRIAASDAGELPVCDRATGRFLGVLTRLDIEAGVEAAPRSG